MAVKTDTEVIIGGKVFTLSGYESEEYLQKVASYINNKMSEYSKLDSFRRQPVDRQNVLLQLNIADDYFKARKQIALLEEDIRAKEKELYDKYFPNGAGSIFTFTIKGDAEKAKKFTESLELFSLLANVADVKSLVIHPASTTHSQLDEEELLACGIHPNTIRLSIGTEHIDDILADLQHGFDAVK